MDFRKRLQQFNIANGRLINNIRDIFDANTASDQAKRMAAGQPRYYQDQQAQKKPTVVFNEPKVIYKPPQQIKPQTPPQPILKQFGINQNIEQRLGPTVKPQPIVKPQSTPDTRTAVAKAYDQINPFDRGRSYQNKGDESKLNVVQRNTTGSGLFNIGKEIVQGTTKGLASLALETKESPYALDDTEKLKSEISRIKTLPYDQRRNELNKTQAFNNKILKPTDRALDELTNDIAKYSGKASPTWKPTGWQKRIFGGDVIKSESQNAKELQPLVEKYMSKIGIEPKTDEQKKRLQNKILFALMTMDAGVGGFTKNAIKPVAKSTVKSNIAEDIIRIGKENGINISEENAKILAENKSRQQAELILKNQIKENKANDVATAITKDLNDNPNSPTLPESPIKQELGTPTIQKPPKDSTVQQPNNLADIQKVFPGAKDVSLSEIRQRYPGLNKVEADEFEIKLKNATTPEEKQLVEAQAAIRQKEIELQVKTAQESPETAVQAAKSAEAQQMADSAAPIAGNAPAKPEVPQTGLEAKPEGATLADLNSVDVKASEYADANVNVPKQNNQILDDLISATDDLKKEGIPDNIIKKVLDSPNAPLTATEFKNAVRREAGKATEPNDVVEVQKAMMEAYNKGDLETAQMLNDSLKESGNNILEGAFPAKSTAINTPIEKTPETIGTPGTPIEGSNILMSHGQPEDLYATNKAIEAEQRNRLTNRANESPVAQLMNQPGDPRLRAQNEKWAQEGPIGSKVDEAVEPVQAVNEATGEIPMGRPEINDAPNYSKAHSAVNGNNLDDMAPLQSRGYKAVDNMDASLKANGHSLDELATAYDRLHKLNEPLPSWVTPKIQKEFKNFTDDLYATAPEGTGYRENYVPESRPIPEGTPMQQKGMSMSSKLDSTFGFTERNENLIPLEELDTGTNRFKRWIDQSVNDKFKYAKEAQKPEYKDFGNDAERVKTYIEGRDKIGDKIAQAADKEVNKRANDGKVVISKDDTKVIDDLQKNYEANATNPVINTNNSKLGVTEALVTKRDALDHIDFYKDSGFKRIDEANITAARLHDDVFKNADNLSDSELEDLILQSFPPNEKVGATAHEEILTRLRNELMDEKELARSQGIPFEPSILPFRRAERSLGQEELRNSLERTRFTDPKTKAFVNKLAVRALSGNRVIEGKAMRISREITSMFYSSLLGLKVSTALQNLTEISRSVGVAGPVHTAKAIAYLTAHPKEAYNIIKRNGQDVNFIKQGAGVAENIKPTTKIGKSYDAVKSGVMIPFNSTESFKDAVFLLSLENKFKSEGLTGRTLSEKVATTYNKTAFKGGEFGTLKGSDNPIGNAIFQFAQYPIKDISLLGENMRKVVSGTSAEKADAWKYLVGNYGAKAAMVVPAWYALGWSAQQTFGAGVPKAGPSVSVPAAFISAANDESQRAEDAGEPFNYQNVLDQVGRKTAGMTIPGGDYLNQAGVLSEIAKKIPGEYDPFIKEGTLQEWNRGYGVNKDGNPRIEGQQSFSGKFKQVIGGKYNTPQSKKYFGQNMFTFKNDLPGDRLDFTLFGDQRGKPLSKPEQEVFNTLETPKAKNAFIANRDKINREKETRWNDVYKNDKGVKAVRDLVKDFIYNKTTKKYESDLISPEKWKAIQSDKSGAYMDNLAKDKIEQANSLGLPLDPIFEDKWAPHRKEILAMRAQNTGDDTEMKDIANSTKDWYKDYMNEYVSYIKDLQAKGEIDDSDSKYGFTDRVKEYWKLTQENPAIPENSKKAYPLIAKYYDSGEEGSDARKNFYKANADALSKAFESQKRDKWNWTNAMREIEGAEPIPWDVFQNVTFGYEDDERKVQKELYYKLGNGYSKGSKGSSDKTEKQYLLSLLSNNATDASPITLKKLKTAYKPAKLKSQVPAGRGKNVRIRLN